jgi:DNA-directed RNA polymerase specialized sigma24 family protein
MADVDTPEPNLATQPVDREFTCTNCGYVSTHEVPRLDTDTQATCVNCGDWTVQTADTEDVVDDAREVAAVLAGPTLSERQALAFLLRKHVGLSRQDAADVMDSSASNVDNLQRRGRDKVAAARRLVADLDALGAEGADSE